MEGFQPSMTDAGTLIGLVIPLEDESFIQHASGQPSVLHQTRFNPKHEYGDLLSPDDVAISKWGWTFPKASDPGAVCSCCGCPFVNLTTIIVSVEGHLRAEGTHAGRAGYGVWFGEGNTWNLSGRLDSPSYRDICNADIDSNYYSSLSNCGGNEDASMDGDGHRTIAGSGNFFYGQTPSSSLATLVALDVALHRLRHIKEHCPQFTRAVIKISDGVISRRLLDPQAQQFRAGQNFRTGLNLNIHGDNDAEDIGTPVSFYFQLLDCNAGKLAELGLKVEWWEVSDWLNQEAGSLVAQAINLGVHNLNYNLA